MTEKKLKEIFILNFIPKFNTFFNSNAWFYHNEFPVRTPDGKKFIDMVLKDDKQYYVLEFKKGKIDTGAVEQLLRYLNNFDKQLYNKKKSIGIIIGLKFSKFELEMCDKFEFKAMLYDGKFLELI